MKKRLHINSGHLLLRLACLCALAGLGTSCRVTRYLKPNEVLYRGAEVHVQPDSTDLAMGKRLEPVLTEITRPQPNSRIVGFPYKVAAYYLLGEPKRDRGLKKWFREKFGERPVLITPNIIDRNVTLLKEYLETEGFFRSQVAGDLKIEKQEGKAIYRVRLAPRYHFNEVVYYADTLFPDSDVELQREFAVTQNNSLLRTDQPYRFEVIKAERSRIDRHLRNTGYYFFRPDFISVEADSTVGGRTVDMELHLSHSMPERARKRYVINNINVYLAPDVSIFNGRDPSSKEDLFRGLVLHDSTHAYNQRIFLDAIGFRPGNFYSTDQNSVSLQRLINLNNFQFVQNRFDVVNRLDSSLLNVSYFLTPLKRQAVRAELNAISRSSGFAGTQLKLNWLNRNFFRAAEQLNLSLSAASEIQFGGPTDQSTLDNNRSGNFRVGVNASITFPRIVSPFFKINPEVSRILPKTTASVNYESIIKTGFYNLNSATALWSYIWRQGPEHEITFNPFSFSFIRTTNISTAFIEQFFENPSLLRLLDNQQILSSSLAYNYTPVNRQSKNLFLFSGNLDVAGTLIGLYHDLRKTPMKDRLLFKDTYAQYARVDGDFRYYRELSPKMRLANRAFVGVGIPYKNSITLPYTRQYFSGGTNSIRAFRARGVGPGNYKRANTASEQFLGLFTGDIKLELNSELRYRFTDFIGAAAFIDAGNVWLYRDTNIYSEQGKFTKNFYKELAVGAGVGLRLDFSFFVFRVDVATPLRVPSNPENQRWTFNQINLRKPEWRMINIAVGYPF